MSFGFGSEGSEHARTDNVGSLFGRAMPREGPLTEEVSVNDFK